MAEAVRILAIDDDEDDLVILRELLGRVRSRSYAFATAATFEEGLAAIARREHDVVLVDHHLGARTGVELVREATRRELPGPFVILSGQGDHEVDLAATEAGAADYMEKNGLTPSLLERTIRNACERARTVAALETHVARQRIVADVGQLALTGMPLPQLLLEACARLTEGLAVDMAKVLELLPDRSAFVLRAAVGFEKARPGDARVPAGTASHAGYTLLDDEPVVVNDFAHETRFAVSDLLASHGAVSGASALVGSLEQPWGVVGVHARRPRAWGADEVSFLRGVANVLGAAIARERAERASRESGASFQAVFENALDAILIADDESRYLDANPAACRLIGLDREAIRARRVADLSPPESREAVAEAWRRFLRAGEMRGEFTVVRPDGSQREVEFAAKANLFPGRHLSILRDVTERVQLEEQLRQSQKMEAIGRLAGGIAHDYNNVLTAINGYAELLLNVLEPTDVHRNHALEILKAGKRAAALTQQLLAFSRKQILKPRVVDPGSVIENLELMLRRLVGEDIQVSIRFQADAGRVRVDPGQLEQVIMNLVVNARDAMPQGGLLEVGTASRRIEPAPPAEPRTGRDDRAGASSRGDIAPGDYVLVTVRDNGCGMSAETVSHLFEPFFTTKDRGTGLGLSMVYGIVKQSGGTIRVESEIGLGTTFEIYLPRVFAPLDEQPGSNAQRRPERGEEVVLVVEDEEMVRALERVALSESGYDVLEASHAQEALALLADHAGPVHVLVTDVVMPGMSGHALAEAVRKLRPDIRVLFTSGYTEDAVALRGLVDPGTHFLQKPFGPRALAAKVREVLNAPARAPSAGQAG